MACNNLGLFAGDTFPSLSLCLSAQTATVYGDSLTIGQTLYSDSGCTIAFTSFFLSNGINLYETNLIGEIIGITGCSCNYLGTFSSASDPDASCLGPFTFDVYGSDLNIGTTLYSDSGCSINYITTFLSDGVTVYGVDLLGVIETIDGCSCGAFVCVHNDTIYDDQYEFAGIFAGQNYYTGQTTNFNIFYSLSESRWCLAQNLGDPCDQFGPYGSLSSCPDFDDTVAYTGFCVTTTTTTNPCVNFDFDAVFDCYVTPTPTLTATNTPTPTPTPTPSTSAICGGVFIDVSVSGYTPTPTPTYTPTPTPTSQIERNCNFSGEVVFNTFNEILQCANSKKFKDCFTGQDYFSSDLILVSETTSKPKEGYVYNAIINNQGRCVIYEGLFENISGVDNVILTNEVGSKIDGACLQCIPNLSSTPTPTPTQTPTPTPSATPCVLVRWYVENNSPNFIKYGYSNCGEELTGGLNAYSSFYVCSSSTPTSNSPNFTATSSETIC